MLKLFPIIVLLFSQISLANTLEVTLKQEPTEVVVQFKEYISETSALQKVFKDLNGNSIDLDNSQFLFSCAYEEHEKLHTCKLKSGLKSHGYRNVLLLPTGDLVITLKTKLAWTFADLTTGQRSQCYMNYYADEFNITICPNTVDIVIHAKEIL